jgi:hypothetical protein
MLVLCRHVNYHILTMLAPKETKSAPLGLRIVPSLKKALEKAAGDDSRTVASMAEKILTDWLKQNGYLKQ